MRRVYVFNMITLDGFFEGPNADISWHNVDEEFNEFAIDQLAKIDLLLFGRVTYELMASYWPTPTAIKNDPIMVARMNGIPKIVFSTTMKDAEWNNTRLVKENIREAILELKQKSGKDIAIFGSANLMASLIPMGLIDEFRIIVNPVVLGNGRALFEDVRTRLDLNLLRTKTFKSGNVLLQYEPKRG